MAILTPGEASNALATVPQVATEAGGDQWVYGGGTVVIWFRNGHTSPITVSMNAVTASIVAPGAGILTVPNRTLAIAAGAQAALVLTNSTVQAYLNPAGQVSFTYTGHNAALTTSAIREI